MKPARVALALLPLLACSAAEIPLNGKACDAEHACPAPLVCNPFTLSCEGDAVCALFADAGMPCTGRDWFLANAGSDTAAGTSASSARRTLGSLALRPGDVVHLASGPYTAAVTTAISGTPGCPITLLGSASPPSTLTHTLVVASSHWTLRGLTFNVADAGYAITTAGASDVSFEQLTFSKSVSADIYFAAQACQGCTVKESTFNDNTARAVVASGTASGLVLRGNSIEGGSDVAVQIEPAGTLVEDNSFSGRYTLAVLKFTSDAIGRNTVRRNVFHDLIAHNINVVQGGGVVRSNSFVRLSTNSVAADVGVFADNLVSQAGIGYGGRAPADGGYNLFDQVVEAYRDGGMGPTDVTGPAQLDAAFVPQPGSAALDTADPSLPVPAGGGARADIGAREAGATRLEDGRYCVQEPEPANQ